MTSTSHKLTDCSQLENLVDINFFTLVQAQIEQPGRWMHSFFNYKHFEKCLVEMNENMNNRISFP